MKVKSLSHVGLTVSDFASAVRWYHDKFGCRLIDDNTLPPAQVTALKDLYGLENSSIKLGFLRVPGGGVVEI
ncbi:MAG: VOC family protein, partial [Spirochaetales bacterium]|nr:VOC family protein [Spirochaetales bacterium]